MIIDNDNSKTIMQNDGCESKVEDKEVPNALQDRLEQARCKTGGNINLSSLFSNGKYFVDRVLSYVINMNPCICYWIRI